MKHALANVPASLCDLMLKNLTATSLLKEAMEGEGAMQGDGAMIEEIEEGMQESLV